MNLENERKAFEEYYIANHHDGDIHPNQQLLEWSDNGDFYFATSVNDLWDMWLASANRVGYKLVPVDSLKEIIDCAYCHIYDRCIGDEGDDVIKHILAMGVEDDH